MSDQKFKQSWERYVPTLKQYVPVVNKVHGKDHPELQEVAALFATMVEQVDKGFEAHLGPLFLRLRIISRDYTKPKDGCETYDAVYDMLHELDIAYFEH